MPRISIITVTYNCKQLLQTTIDSVALQSFSDFDHIIIDGHSTDGTIDVIKKNLDTITYWISEPDQGIYDAMNKGLKAAKGDYVIYLNAGDTFYEKETLKKIPFDKYPNAGIFYGETIILNQDGEELGLRRKKLPHNLTWKHFRRGMVVCHQSILVKRNIAPYYKLNYRYTADIEWVLKSLQLSKQNIFTNSIISNFVEGGFSNQNLKNSWMDRFTILKKNFGLFKTILSHLVFIFENLFLKMKILNQYRKIDHWDS